MATAVLGMQWGDEGKGKLVDVLSEQATIVARYQGGANAGHTVRVEAYDIEGNLLPRWTSTWYGLPAPAEGESCILLQPCYDHDNQLPEEDIRKAMAAGAQPGSCLMMPVQPGGI